MGIRPAIRLLIAITLLLVNRPAQAQQFYFNHLTSEEGLSHNSVFSIAQDYKGFMWFGTRDGLSRYDSQVIKTYDFGGHNPGVEANRVNCVYADGRELWVGTDVGLFQYNFAADAFRPVPLGPAATQVLSIRRTADGALWVGGSDGIRIISRRGAVRHVLPGQAIQAMCEFRRGAVIVLQEGQARILNAEGGILATPTMDPSGPEGATSMQCSAVFADHEGRTWLGTNGNLLLLDEPALRFRPVPWFRQLLKAPVHIIRTISEDHAGNLWLGSESGAIVVDKARRHAQWFDQSFAAAPHQLPGGAVYSSCVGADGTVWLGTYFDGVSYTKPAGVAFTHLFAAGPGRSLAGKAVSQVCEDEQQRLWIGTEDAGVSVQDRATGHYRYYNRQNGLSDNNVHALLVEPKGPAWVGTFLGGLNRLNPATGATTIYQHTPGDSTSLSNNRVFSIYRDRNRTLWVGTQHGLNILDEKSGRFRLFRPAELGDTFIYAVWEDAARQLWVATRYSGIYRYDAARNLLAHYDADNTPALHSNLIISIYEDAHGNLWFGTLDGGVGYWDHARQAFQAAPINQYLPSQTVYGVLEDNGGTYWFSTNRGLVSFDPKRRAYRTFDKSSGLQTTQFNFKSSFKDTRGTLYFGTVNGLCSFAPAALARQVFDPPVYFTGLQLFNKAVPVGPQSVLVRSLDETPKLTFAYAQNVITLDFVAIDYFSRGANSFSYYLEGFDDTWSPKTTVNSRTYTNLSPGSYTFHVRAYRSDGELSPHERTLTLVIRPPFWRSGYSYGLYVLLAIGGLWLYRRISHFLSEQQLAVQVERVKRVEREKTEELTQQKLNFFTFLTNELNTPITLIMAEVEGLMRANHTWQTDAAPNYKAIEKNAKRLQILITQITAQHKTPGESAKLDLTDADVVAFIKDTLQGFDPLLQARHLAKELHFSQPFLMATFDSGKLEMLLGNLVFFLARELPENGVLALSVDLASVTQQPVCQLSLRFALPGQAALLQRLRANYGMSSPPEALFRPGDASSIGLQLAFRLLELLEGTAAFAEAPGAEALTVTLPIQKSSARRHTESRKPDFLSTPLGHLPDAAPSLESNLAAALGEGPAAPGQRTMLIADQSQDLMQLLKRNYQADYRILLASTCAEALKKAETALPEIILCDSSIADKDHRPLCVILKANPLTQSIPLILLLSDKADQTIIRGLHGGPDGYLSKPFNLPELDLLVANNLRAVSRLRTKLVTGLTDSRFTTLPARNKEQEFVLKFAALVNRHYQDKDIDVDSLAQQMGCSRSQLQTKLKALTGFSTKEYLNDYRLTVARQLLENGRSVAEVAFETGFNDPNYFGRAFKKKYGLTPSKAG